MPAAAASTAMITAMDIPIICGKSNLFGGFESLSSFDVLSFSDFLGPVEELGTIDPLGTSDVFVGYNVVEFSYSDPDCEDTS